MAVVSWPARRRVIVSSRACWSLMPRPSSSRAAMSIERRSVPSPVSPARCERRRSRTHGVEALHRGGGAGGCRAWEPVPVGDAHHDGVGVAGGDGLEALADLLRAGAHVGAEERAADDVERGEGRIMSAWTSRTFAVAPAVHVGARELDHRAGRSSAMPSRWKAGWARRRWRRQNSPSLVSRLQVPRIRAAGPARTGPCGAGGCA